MTDIRVHKENDVYMYIQSDMSIAHELADYFSFYADNYKWHPKYKSRVWDGKIRLFSTYSKQMYVGLLEKLIKFAERNKYSIEVDPDLDVANNVNPKDIAHFVNDLNIHSQGTKLTPDDYQYFTVWKCMNDKRALIESPTSSGKSLMIYSMVRWYLKNHDKKILIVVPITGLVSQLYSDFDDYSSEVNWSPDGNAYKITGGVEKDNIRERIVISTWQSIYKLPKDWYSDFGMVIGDEAHQFKAKSLTDIMHKLTDCPFKIGTTGTTGSKTINRLTLEGLFGKITKVISTKELMQRGRVSKLDIKCISLNYSDEDKKFAKAEKSKYQDEVKWLTKHEKRTSFVANLSASFKENSLILFNNIEHGKAIYEAILEKTPETRSVFFIYGGTDKEAREEVRHIVENEKDAIIVASYGTFSTGVNIRNIHHVVFASPSKSEIRVLQSIGRGLRKSKTKDSVILYDIVDDLSWKKHKNYALKHFLERMNIYIKEEFEYSFIKVDL